jgi:lactate permease
MAAAQGLGAAIGNAVAPHNIIAGAATVGLSGREGPVMRLTVTPVLAYALGAGIILLLWTA